MRLDDSFETGAEPDAVAQATRMTEELLGSMTADLVARGTGLSLQTIRHIARGGSRRVSKQTRESLKNLHDKFRSEGMELVTKLKLMQPKKALPPVLRKMETDTDAPAESPQDPFSAEVVSVMKQDLAAAEKRLVLLRKMMELAKEL